MGRAIVDIEKKKRGRPRTDATPVLVRIEPDLLSDLDAFIADESDPKPSRPDAIRRLLSDALITMGLRKVQ